MPKKREKTLRVLSLARLIVKARTEMRAQTRQCVGQGKKTILSRSPRVLRRRQACWLAQRQDERQGSRTWSQRSSVSSLGSRHTNSVQNS